MYRIIEQEGFPQVQMRKFAIIKSIAAINAAEQSQKKEKKIGEK